MAVEHIKIESTDIFLETIDERKGKITISNTWGYNFSYSWGAMGKPLKDFLIGCDKSYFARALCPIDKMNVFCGKRTATAIRRAIKEFLPNWYTHTEFQKEMRKSIREVESIQDIHDFYRMA